MMTFAQWLDAEPGRATQAAVHFDVTLSAISQWASKGVPPKRMRAVREFTGGAVDLETMVPESHPVRCDA